MNMFIQIVDGAPYGNPIVEDNFRQAFPNIDTNNLPEGWARFERIEKPLISPYEVYEGVIYEQHGDVFKDVHKIREMTNAEKTEKQNNIKQIWADTEGFSSWIFDEETCSFKPPVAAPEDWQSYKWDEETTSWVEVT